MVNQNLCPVCGYNMEEPPRDYNICPSCGTEFGLHDKNTSVEDLRAAWLKTGPRWWSSSDSQPPDWKPMMQLAGLLLGRASISVYSNYYGLGVVINQAPVAGSDQMNSAYTLSESPYR